MHEGKRLPEAIQLLQSFARSNDVAVKNSPEAPSPEIAGPMLDMRLASGECEAFSYTSLTRMKFLPGDTIVLQFDGIRVTIEGRRLLSLYRGLLEHRLCFIEQEFEAKGIVKQDGPVVETIDIEG